MALHQTYCFKPLKGCSYLQKSLHYILICCFYSTCVKFKANGEQISLNNDIQMLFLSASWDHVICDFSEFFNHEVGNETNECQWQFMWIHLKKSH